MLPLLIHITAHMIMHAVVLTYYSPGFESKLIEVWNSKVEAISAIALSGATDQHRAVTTCDSSARVCTYLLTTVRTG